MKKFLALVLFLKVANGFFFIDPALGTRPMFDDKFWKHFENSMKRIGETIKTASHEIADDSSAESTEDSEVEKLQPHDPFNMFPFYGMTPSRPWWLGKNVCVTKEETDLASENTETSEEFGLSTRMETCSGSHGRYTCTTTVRGPGKHVRTSVKYECCHGFALKKNRCVQVNLLNFTEAAKETAPEFAQMMEQSGILDKLEKSDGNFTLFVVDNQALDDLRENLDHMNELELLVAPARRRRALGESETNEGRADGSEMAPALNKVLQNHIFKGVLHSSDFANNKILESMSGDPLRLNVFPGGLSPSVRTVNCKRLIKADRMAERGMVHVLDGVLKPVHRTVSQILQEDARFSIFRSLLEEADLMDRLSNDTVTVFAPTDAAFRALPADFLQTHKSCSAAIARHHVAPHMLCMSGLVDTWSINSLAGERLRMERSPEGVTVDDKKVVLMDVVGVNGVVHVLDAVLMPDAARKLDQVLEDRNLTTFRKLLTESGVESTTDVTWFAPREEAFADPEVQKKLEQLRENPEELRKIILYHSTQPQIELTTLENQQEITTRHGELGLKFSMYTEGPGFSIMAPRATVNCARVRITDNKACGVNVHEIDRLLIPPSGDVISTLVDKPEFSILNKVIEKAGLIDDLKTSEPITLLAPTDNAFNDLPARVLNALLANETFAREVLEKHILPESICCHGVASQSWLWSQRVQTKDGSFLSARRDALGHVLFGRARVSHCDRIATNGIVHTVTNVLVPREDHNPFTQFFSNNGYKLQGANPNIDVMLFGI